jgi:hypothetical protein
MTESSIFKVVFIWKTISYKMAICQLQGFGGIHCHQDVRIATRGELIPVKPGIDNKTHLNLLTDYQAVTVPLDGLPGDSGGDGGHEH